MDYLVKHELVALLRAYEYQQELVFNRNRMSTQQSKAWDRLTNIRVVLMDKLFIENNTPPMESSVHKCNENNDLDMSLPSEKYITPKLHQTTL